MQSVPSPSYVDQRDRSSRSYALPVWRGLRLLARHPLALTLRRSARNLRWTISGARLSNPGLPQQIHSILFVCLGNICRSPFAARLATKKLASLGATSTPCGSAGLRIRTQARSPLEAYAAAVMFDISLEDREPVAIERQFLEAYSIVVVMEASHLWHLRKAFPEFTDRIFLLPLFERREMAGYDRYNITDPFGRTQAEFVACYHRIDAALDSLLAAVAASSILISPPDGGCKPC